MSISSTNRRNDYVGNGSTATYAYTFKILSNADLLVTERVIATGVETTLALTSGYTVTGVGQPSGGNIVLVAGNLPSTKALTIRMARSLKQETDIRNQGDFFPEVHEDAFDSVVMQNLTQQDELDRSMKLPETVAASVFSTELPAGIAGSVGKALITNSSGDGFEVGPSADEIEAAQGYATAASASATAASGSATAAAASATAASGSATAAAASAASAAATLASALWRDVVFITNASSPVTIAQADNGKLYVADTSSGAITINLPTIAGIALPFNIGVKLDAGASAVTIARGGTDTIGGATSYTLNVVEQGVQLIADTDGSPDQWTPVAFGAKDVLSSLLNTKGDLLSRTSSDLAKLAVGNNNEVLVADSSTTTGQRWGRADGSLSLQNIGLSASVSSNALTINMVTAGGSTPSSTAPCVVAFRNATLTTGQYSLVSVTGSLSVTVSSGSTLGHANNSPFYIYVYAINNAGTAELAVSARVFDDGTVVSTTAEGGAGGADAFGTMYSTTARSNVACRLIGRLLSTQTTAGTWASAMTEVSLAPFTAHELNKAIAFKARKSANQTISNNTITKVTWDTPVIDTVNGWDSANNRYIIRVPGVYSVAGQVLHELDATNLRNTSIYLNGAQDFITDMVAASTANIAPRSENIYNCIVGDYFEIHSFQNSGATRSLIGSDQRNVFTVEFLGSV